MSLWVPFRAQSIRSARNTCLSTKEQQNPSSSDEVTAFCSREDENKNRPGFEAHFGRYMVGSARSELQMTPYKGQVRKWSKVRKMQVKMMKNELLPIRFCVIVDHSGVPPAPSRASARPLRLLPRVSHAPYHLGLYFLTLDHFLTCPLYTVCC